VHTESRVARHFEIKAVRRDPVTSSVELSRFAGEWWRQLLDRVDLALPIFCAVTVIRAATLIRAATFVRAMTLIRAG